LAKQPLEVRTIGDTNLDDSSSRSKRRQIVLPKNGGPLLDREDFAVLAEQIADVGLDNPYKLSDQCLVNLLSSFLSPAKDRIYS
jgi:hypothetical protein